MINKLDIIFELGLDSCLDFQIMVGFGYGHVRSISDPNPSLIWAFSFSNHLIYWICFFYHKATNFIHKKTLNSPMTMVNIDKVLRKKKSFYVKRN